MNPCYKCTRRCAGCGAACEDFKKFRAERQVIYQQRYNDMIADSIIVDGVRKQIRIKRDRKY